jgi:hypothetical protein
VLISMRRKLNSKRGPWSAVSSKSREQRPAAYGQKLAASRRRQPPAIGNISSGRASGSPSPACRNAALQSLHRSAVRRSSSRCRRLSTLATLGLAAVLHKQHIPPPFDDDSTETFYAGFQWGGFVGACGMGHHAVPAFRRQQPSSNSIISTHPASQPASQPADSG